MMTKKAVIRHLEERLSSLYAYEILFITDAKTEEVSIKTDRTRVDDKAELWKKAYDREM